MQPLKTRLTAAFISVPTLIIVCDVVNAENPGLEEDFDQSISMYVTALHQRRNQTVPTMLVKLQSLANPRIDIPLPSTSSTYSCSYKSVAVPNRLPPSLSPSPSLPIHTWEPAIQSCRLMLKEWSPTNHIKYTGCQKDSHELDISRRGLHRMIGARERQMDGCWKAW